MLGPGCGICPWGGEYLLGIIKARINELIEENKELANCAEMLGQYCYYRGHLVIQTFSNNLLDFDQRWYFLQISRIARHRQIPKHVKNARNELSTIKDSKSRKEANRRKHSKPGTVPYIPEREKNVVDES